MSESGRQPSGRFSFPKPPVGFQAMPSTLTRGNAKTGGKWESGTTTSVNNKSAHHPLINGEP